MSTASRLQRYALIYNQIAHIGANINELTHRDELERQAQEAARALFRKMYPRRKFTVDGYMDAIAHAKLADIAKPYRDQYQRKHAAFQQACWRAEKTLESTAYDLTTFCRPSPSQSLNACTNPVDVANSSSFGLSYGITRAREHATHYADMLKAHGFNAYVNQSPIEGNRATFTVMTNAEMWQFDLITRAQSSIVLQKMDRLCEEHNFLRIHKHNMHRQRKHKR